jgi:hypothetical protein
MSIILEKKEETLLHRIPSSDVDPKTEDGMAQCSSPPLPATPFLLVLKERKIRRTF